MNHDSTLSIERNDGTVMHLMLSPHAVLLQQCQHDFQAALKLCRSVDVTHERFTQTKPFAFGILHNPHTAFRHLILHMFKLFKLSFALYCSNRIDTVEAEVFKRS